MDEVAQFDVDNTDEINVWTLPKIVAQGEFQITQVKIKHESFILADAFSFDKETNQMMFNSTVLEGLSFDQAQQVSGESSITITFIDDIGNVYPYDKKFVLHPKF